MAVSRRTFLPATAAGLLGLAQARVHGNEAQRAPAASPPAGVAPPNLSFQAIVAAINSFGSRVLGEMMARDTGDVTLSPFSLVSALSMLTVGARGETQRQLRSALGFADLSIEALSDAFEALNRSLSEQSNAAMRLRVANALWTARPGASDARMALQRAFGAELNPIDFSNAGAAGEINRWVSRATEQAIQQIVEQVNADTSFVLTNATYFKGRWANEFRPADTQEEPFLSASGTERNLPTMRQGLTAFYAARDGLHALLLPYVGGRLQLVVVTSVAREDYRRLAGALEQQGFADTLAQFRSFEQHLVSLRLPRFRTETGGDLSQLLIVLGLGPVLGRGADFTGIAPGANIDTRVVQRALVDVNEEGTTAAAATLMEVRTSQVRRRTVEFNADRPFVYALVDVRTRLHLFAGIVRG